LSGAAKKRKRKQDEKIRESQRGDLNKYFPVKSNVDVNNNNQRPISDPGQADEDNTDGDIKVNEQSSNNFLVVVDAAIASLEDRFEQLNAFAKVFGFLFNSKNLKSLDDSNLQNNCTTFAQTFTHNKACDVDLDDFVSELKVLQVTLPDDLSALEILQFVTTADCYPNVSVAYRILLTIPVTVASAERSFSKLKLLKNCLRSTMLQDRLNGLATCCIEKDILESIDLETIINDFASRNARRSFLEKH
jgi:hypothetical protein